MVRVRLSGRVLMMDWNVDVEDEIEVGADESRRKDYHFWKLESWAEAATIHGGVLCRSASNSVTFLRIPMPEIM